MDTIPTAEIAKSQQEVAKPQETAEKKDTPASSKFQKAEAKFTSLSTELKQAFGKLSKESPHIVFDVEQHELDQLSEKLAKLNQDTTQTLGVPSENTTVSNDSIEHPQSATVKQESVPEAIASATSLEQIATAPVTNGEGGVPITAVPSKPAETSVSPETTQPLQVAQEGDANIATDGQESVKPEDPQVDTAEEIRDPRGRAARVLQELQDRAKTRELEKVFTTEGMLGDSDKIEGHQIDFIHQGDRTIASFKMTAAMVEKVKSDVISTSAPDAISEGSFDFQSTVGQISSQGECWVIKVDDNTTVYVSKGEKKGYEHKDYDYTKPIKDAEGNIIGFESTTINEPGEPVRALMGAVKIEVQGLTDVQEIAGKVDTAFQRLKITEALVTPDQQAENQYKEARYRWQHRLEDDQTWQIQREQYAAEHGTELIDHLERQEVFPEYYTIVDQGASERYQRDGRIFLTHSVYNPATLASILKNGLLSSHERFKRGIFNTGMSTEQDFFTGGADSVFIRAVPESASDYIASLYNVHLLINPQVLDRTDWYAYNFDSYGTTDPSTFDSRPSPEQFLAAQRQCFFSGNEIMMRRGIPPEMISGVVIGDEYSRANIIANLQAAGIQDVNGVPLDQFITIASTFGDVKKANGIVSLEPEVPEPYTPDVNTSFGMPTEMPDQLTPTPTSEAEVAPTPTKNLNKYFKPGEFSKIFFDKLAIDDLIKVMQEKGLVNTPTIPSIQNQENIPIPTATTAKSKDDV